MAGYKSIFRITCICLIPGLLLWSLDVPTLVSLLANKPKAALEYIDFLEPRLCDLDLDLLSHLAGLFDITSPQMQEYFRSIRPRGRSRWVINRFTHVILESSPNFIGPMLV